MQPYVKLILTHYQTPHHYGQLKTPTVTHTEKNPACGDELTVDLLIENNKIKDFKFRGKGCAISLAAMSIWSDQIIGAALPHLIAFSEQNLLNLLPVTLSLSRQKCALLSLFTIKNAISKSPPPPAL